MFKTDPNNPLHQLDPVILAAIRTVREIRRKEKDAALEQEKQTTQS